MSQKPSAPRPFLDSAPALPSWLRGDGFPAKIRHLIESLFGIPKIRTLFAQAADNPRPDFFTSVLRLSGIHTEAEGVHEAIPKSGGVIVIANHPYGGADAMPLGSLCIQARRDTLILANSVAEGARGLSDWLIPLNILSEPGAGRKNLLALKRASNHVKQGGLLAVFPAGAVSYYQSDQGKILDPPWSEHIARIAIKTNTPVLPIYFKGLNPLWFQILGAKVPFFRTAAIPPAFLAMRGKTIACSAGELIAPEILAAQTKPTDYLREQTYRLAES
ncbi:hypothetical protein Rhal01_01715 [Rubritalea halochordaticola]|uniref:Phospholipid/glycerol acyltransferase domain-containing protein n=1 Tax=Rubritalea halochordaticola TaxID=714537 RepID=A0ABP9UYU3_9BACT